MTDALTDPAPNPPISQHEVGEGAPYLPSFIDRFTNFIQRLPIPYGLTYLSLFILESAIFLVLSWADGWLPAYRIDLLVFAFPIWLWGPLVIVTYLDSLSLRTLAEFEPLLELQPEAKRRLEYEFTNMPPRTVLLSAVAWLGAYLFFWFAAFAPGTVGYGVGPLAMRIWFIAGFVSFVVGSVIYYHSF